MKYLFSTIFLFLAIGFTAHADSRPAFSAIAQECQRLFSPQYRQACYETATRLQISTVWINNCDRGFSDGRDELACLSLVHETNIGSVEFDWCIRNMNDVPNEFKCIRQMSLHPVESVRRDLCIREYDNDSNELRCLRDLNAYPEISNRAFENCSENTGNDTAHRRCILDYAASVIQDVDQFAPIEAVAQ